MMVETAKLPSRNQQHKPANTTSQQPDQSAFQSSTFNQSAGRALDQKTLNQLAMGLAGTGIFLILLSLLMYNDLLPFLSNEGTWSNEDAVAYEESAMAFHNASFDKKISADDLKETEDEYLANRERLDAILNRGKTWPRIVQVTGFVFVGLGFISYIAAISKEST